MRLVIVELDTNTDEGRALAFALAELRDDDALRSKLEAEARPPDFRLDNVLIADRKGGWTALEWSLRDATHEIVALVVRERGGS